MKNISLYIIAFVSLAMMSCATQNIFTAPTVVQNNSDSNYQYTLRKDDKINISVWDHDDLSVGSLYGIYNSNEVYGKWLILDNKGEVAVPKIGNIQLSGLTVLQAEEKLRNEYKKWIVNPIIELKVLNKEVTIIGELKTPGKYLLEKDQNTLIEIIGKAGDFDFYADKKHIQIIRNENGKSEKILIDLTGKNSYGFAGFNIHPGDVIYVPSRKGKHWDKRAGSTIVPIATVVSSIVLVLGIVKK